MDSDTYNISQPYSAQVDNAIVWLCQNSRCRAMRGIIPVNVQHIALNANLRYWNLASARKIEVKVFSEYVTLVF